MDRVCSKGLEQKNDFIPEITRTSTQRSQQIRPVSAVVVSFSDYGGGGY